MEEKEEGKKGGKKKGGKKEGKKKGGKEDEKEKAEKEGKEEVSEVSEETEEDKKSLRYWLSDVYLTTESQLGIHNRIAEDGSILLYDFIRPSVYEELLHQLQLLEGIKGTNSLTSKKRPKTIRQKKLEDEGVTEISLPLRTTHTHWEPIGPPNLRHYFCLSQKSENPSAIPHAKLLEFVEFLRSPVFLSLIRKLSGLDLSRCSGDIRRFPAGCYTLMSDVDPEIDRESLDVNFCLVGYVLFCLSILFLSFLSIFFPSLDFSSPNFFLSLFTFSHLSFSHSLIFSLSHFLISRNEEWEEGHGGWVSYVAKDEEDGELLTVLPHKNSLSIVFRDTGCLQFVKYVNHTAPSTRYDIALTYYE
jgi:hypothetical protein